MSKIRREADECKIDIAAIAKSHSDLVASMTGGQLSFRRSGQRPFGQSVASHLIINA